MALPISSITARTYHQVRHALHTLVQNVICEGERLCEGCLFIGQTEQVLVWNDDQRINDLLQRLYPVLSLTHALGTLKLEWLGHNAHGQNAQFTRGLRDDRRGPCPSASAHAGCDKAHVRAG
jgi:hypothetical protein